MINVNGADYIKENGIWYVVVSGEKGYQVISQKLIEQLDLIMDLNNDLQSFTDKE